MSMPKKRAVILVIILSVVLGACIGGTSQKQPVPETSAPQTTAVTMPPPPLETTGLTPEPTIKKPKTEEELKMEFNIMSKGFEDGGDIPVKYTCDGEDVSPPLSWGDPPEGSKSLALIMDDPDAPFGVFSHWVLFNLPVGTRDLAEGVPKEEVLTSGGVQGRTDFGAIGYGGPCPPPGKPHTYRFILYALNEELDLSPDATRGDVLKVMEGHILGKTELRGRYGR